MGNTPSWWPLIGSERARAVAVRVSSYLALWRTPLARVPDGFVKCRGPSPQREWELSGSRIQKSTPKRLKKRVKGMIRFLGSCP